MSLYSDERINDYAEAHSSGPDEVLHRLWRETNLTTVYPRMISGPLQGRFLQLICQMINPTNVLEIGTFTGYSAICLARGMQRNGLLHTIDINDEIEETAMRYFREAGVDHQIQLHIGDACDIIPGLSGLFDLVFIDGDKEQYSRYFEIVFPKVRAGGFILIDNVLWGGKVLPGCTDQDKETKSIREFNSMIAEDVRVDKLFLPFRDGLFILRKTAE